MEVLYTTIEFLLNNDYGTFVKGDVLTMYIDDSQVVSSSGFTNTGVKVYKNGVLITSGPTIGRRSRLSIIQHNPIICYTTERVDWAYVTYYPYLLYRTIPDDPACATPIVCDLILAGQPEVVSASSDVSADGEIHVNATSTYTIEYGLADFIYGSGQASGSFTGLLPGTYRVYMRDEKNCTLQLLVEVPYDDTYDVRFVNEYTDITGVDTKIEIQKRAYAGASEEVCGSDTPFEIQLRGEGETNKFTPVLSTSASINLTSVTESQFFELYTNNVNLYRVKYYKNNVLKWTGKVLPFEYSEEYKAAPYYISVVSTDGLAELKDIYYFQPNGQKYSGTTKLIKLIAFCLKRTSLDLNIRVGVNMYSTGMDDGDGDDPLDQAYIDVECFYLKEAEPSLLFIIQSILEPFGARLVQWDDYWNIVRVEELGQVFDYREFDIYGDYVSNGAIDPLVDIDYPSERGVMFAAFPNLEMRPGYGKLIVNYNLGLKENILKNGDFSLMYEYSPTDEVYVEKIDTSGWQLIPNGYPILSQFEIVQDENVAWVLSHDAQMFSSSDAGTAYVESEPYNVKMGVANNLKLFVRYKIRRTDRANINYPYVKMRVMVKYGSLYLTSSGQWSSVFNTIDFLATKINEYLEGEVVADQPITGTPVDGMDLIVRLYHATPYFVEHTSLTSLRDSPTFDNPVLKKPTGYKTEVRDAFTGDDTQYYYELEETNLAESGYDVVKPADDNAFLRRRWILKHKRVINNALDSITDLCLDKVQIEFLTYRQSPIDTVVRVANGEPGNREILDKELIIGSDPTLITTSYYALVRLPIRRGRAVSFERLQDVPQTVNILSADLIYTGWLRDATGAAWDNWTRDGIAEADKLHGIWLRMNSLQYNKSWRLLRATLESRTRNFGMLDSFREVNDGNRRYVPISVTLDDKNNRYNSELLELMGVFSDTDTEGGSDGSGTAPFTSAFTTGFGGGYN
jgi:hypothetical protein